MGEDDREGKSTRAVYGDSEGEEEEEKETTGRGRGDATSPIDGEERKHQEKKGAGRERDDIVTTPSAGADSVSSDPEGKRERSRYRTSASGAQMPEPASALHRDGSEEEGEEEGLTQREVSGEEGKKEAEEDEEGVVGKSEGGNEQGTLSEEKEGAVGGEVGEEKGGEKGVEASQPAMLKTSLKFPKPKGPGRAAGPMVTAQRRTATPTDTDRCACVCLSVC